MDSSFPFTVSLDLATKGVGAPAAKTYEAAFKDAQTALHALLHGDEKLELFSNIEREDDIAQAAGVAKALSANASTIFIFGIGGSSLGGQALSELVAPSHRPRVVFLDNPDPVTYARELSTADLKTTRFVAISKSGGTAETLAQTLIAVDAIEKAGGGAYLKQHFAVVTEPKKSPLKQFGEELGCPVLDHPLGIGGRYSVLSMVGVLPGLLMGLDFKALRAGARMALEHPAASVEGAALNWALMREGRLNETVLWPYADRLKTFGAWWRQLWAESLGKDGKGTTPLTVLGPVDQHSQLQLFLDGPGAQLFTLIDTETAGQGQRIPADGAHRLGADYLSARFLGDLIDAECRATAETLAARGRPVRRISVPKLDEHALGALFMHFMLETILTGRLMGVDPFDQPAVEEGKVLARRYLDKSAR